MLKVVMYEGERYVKIVDIASFIYGPVNKIKHAGKICRGDPVLENYTFKMPCETKGGIQNCWVIREDAIVFYLMKLNAKMMSEGEKEQYRTLFDYYTNSSIKMSSGESSNYFFSEACLRDELFREGRIRDINILDKEVVYDFGRIDLYGIDDRERECCIELKNKHGYGYTKEQLMRYKDSGQFDRIVYLSSGGEDQELLDWFNENSVEVFVYKRGLEIEKLI